METALEVEGGTLTDLVRELLVEDEESVTAYIEQSWVTRAIEALQDARRRASLTQEEVAKRLSTTQSAIARLENNHEGSISLRRYVRYALACGMAPFDITMEPVSAMRDYILQDPDAARTPLAYCERNMRAE
jgi:transcriptional regulator with XRE-family HTH domain